MDASASTFSDVAKNNVYGFFLKIENSEFPTAVKQKSTVIKYTKLPDFDFEPQVSWPHQSMQTRSRRFITLEEPERASPRSLNVEQFAQSPEMSSNLSKRKIVTITEDDEYDLHPRFSKDTRKGSSVKTTNRSIGTDFKEPKQSTQRTTSRLSSSSKYLRETKPSAKINVYEEKDPNPKSNYRSKHSNINYDPIDNTRSRAAKEKEPIRKSRSVNSSKSNVSKSYVTPRESEKALSLIKSKLYDNLKSTAKKLEKSKPRNKSPPLQTVNKVTFLKELQNKHKPVTVIHVPLENRHRRSSSATPVTGSSAYPSETELVKPVTRYRDMDTSTEPQPLKVDSITEMDHFEPEIIYKCLHSTDVQTEVINGIFDSLEIPNVTLTTDKSESKGESHSMHSKSLPNLQGPPPSNEESSYHKSTSFIISRASVTYTTKQKINLHVVGGNDDAYPNQPPSPLSYPINVVSVFKKEMQNGKANNIVINDKVKSKTSKEYKNRINDIKSLDCSYVANSDKLMKPSDIISTIRVNDELLRSEYICEQFQRELNFIDSFFESLQYLENCSLSDKSYKNDKIDELVKHPELLESELEGKTLEYDSFFSKFENGANIDDTETMASKNLFLLNILIRDEQRRAKNLLFVLKRREDALKDFTKSQILYLENKKKQDNTDISALKKKQRGALLKLQHECGEMQRMRRALLALSDRRKGTLMKSKRDLELKLNNNVDKIIIGKKKPKRSASADRASPLKCFDLSSSCDDSSAASSRRTSAETTPERSPEHTRAQPAYNPASAEKSIQTGHCGCADRSTDTADEHFIIVDGSYLNILFQNLSLPLIFSGGKQYEVNEEALKNIVDSTNCQQHMNGTDVQTFMDQIKSRDLDTSSSPSTARSLVEEYDQYYRGLNECDKSQEDETDYRSSSTICELSDAMVQASSEVMEHRSYTSASTMTIGSNDTLVQTVQPNSDPCIYEAKVENEDVPLVSPTGPLPVPAGAAAVSDTPSVTDVPTWNPLKTSSSTSFSESSQSLCELVSSVASFTPQCEAEELRRQQLAIEREIKELEQQQCQLLVVREIPDKPPPPYTPPAEARVSRNPRKFHAGDGTDDRIRAYITEPTTEPCEPTDTFDVFIHDFCQETLDRHAQDRSAQPWDACNLLPTKPAPEPEQVANEATAELSAVLAGAKPTVVSGVSSRRSDHIDDILFTEWRRVEPEWTAIHTDEAIVKNQLFESIFQRILTDTVDEYKRTVLCDHPE